MVPQRVVVHQRQVLNAEKERCLSLQAWYDKASSLRHATWKSKVNAKSGKHSSSHPNCAPRQPVAAQQRLCCVVLPQVFKVATCALMKPSAHVLPFANGSNTLKNVELDRKPPRHCGSYTKSNVNDDVRVLGGASSFGLAVCQSSGVATSSQEVQSLLTGQLLLVCACSAARCFSSKHLPLACMPGDRPSSLASTCI